MRNVLLCLVLAATTVGCTTKVARPDARQVASKARIAVVVEQNTLTAPNLQDDVRGKLPQTIIETRTGVPVTDASTADVLIKVEILKTNFTHAVNWQWQIVDAATGDILRTKSDQSAFGADAQAIANQITTELATLDLSGPRGSNTRLADANTAPAPDATLEMPASNTDGSNAWAVVVGVENYREDLPAVTGATADAKAFAEFARSTLNVPEQNIKLLLGERASRADMSGALLEWLPRNAVDDGGRVYVFFSGHGAPDVETGSSYLLPYDANPTYIKSGGLSVSTLQKKLAELDNQEVFVFLDACFSGSGERSVLAEGTRPVVPVKEIERQAGVVTFSASGPDETTGAHLSGAHGLFSYHLLTGLGGAADIDGDGDISIAELEAHLIESVQVDARRQNRDQTPTASVPDDVEKSKALVSGIAK